MEPAFAVMDGDSWVDLRRRSETGVARRSSATRPVGG